MSKIHFTYLKQNRSFTSKRDMQVQLQSHKKNLVQIVQCIQKGLNYFVLVPNLAHKTALNPINQGFCFQKKALQNISHETYRQMGFNPAWFVMINQSDFQISFVILKASSTCHRLEYCSHLYHQPTHKAIYLGNQ